MMNKIEMEKNGMHKSLSASEKVDFLSLIAAKVNSRWKRNTDFITEYQQQQKRAKKSHDFTIQQDNGKESKGESQSIQTKKGDNHNCSYNDNKTVQHLQYELEKVRQKCEELESENMQFRGRLNDNKFDEVILSHEEMLEGKNKELVETKELCATIKQELVEKSEEVSKLQDEKEKFQKEIKELNKLLEKNEKRSELVNDNLRINFENELKGKQEEIEDLQRQLDEMSGFGFAKVKAEKEKSAQFENENLRLKNEISELEGLFEEIQEQFENKLKEKNNEIVEMMVEWMENHEVLSATREENGELKSENDCAKREITKLTRELAAKQVEYGCQSNSLKKLEKEVKAKINEIGKLNKKINELTITHGQKLKKIENEANQREKWIQQMKKASVQSSKHENEDMAKQLQELECYLKGKQAEIELLLSDREQIISFAENLKKITGFPDNANFPLVIQLEEFTVFINDKLRLLEWHMKTVSVLRAKGIQIDFPSHTS